MSNLTLDVVWLTFMPVYQHSIGKILFLFFVMLNKFLTVAFSRGKDRSNKKILCFQLSILIVDIGWGFLVCPVFLFPLTAILCNGIICGSEGSGHVGVVVLIQCTVQVGITMCLTLHYKYTTIAKMTNYREISATEKIVVRLIFIVALEMPVVGMIIASNSHKELRQLLIDE
ncbi:hypothetical protein PMAYCL1PPCAC_01130, partial [Pristionchus mayeri]